MKGIIPILSMAMVLWFFDSFCGVKGSAEESIERGLWAVWLGDPFPGYLSAAEKQKMLDIGTSYLVACIPNDSVYMDFCDSTGGTITMNIEGPRQPVHPGHQKLWTYITTHNPPDTAVITQYIQAMYREYGNHLGLKTYMIMHETAAYDSNKNFAMQYACQQVHAIDANLGHYTLVVAPINILNSNPGFFAQIPDLDIFEMDWYPFHYNCPYQGSAFQQALDEMIAAYQTTKEATNSHQVEWHAIIQTHGSGDPATFQFRLPTKQEIFCQAFLALTRGAKGILGFTYGSMYGPYEFYYGPLTPNREIARYHSRPGDSLSSMYEDVRDLFHVIGSIGYVMHKLKSLQSFNSQYIPAESYIDSIRGDEIINGKGTAEIGTFVDTTVSPHVDYFMLVNRECLATEGANYDVFVTKTGGPYQIRDMYSDTIVGNVNGIGDYFIVYLGPGEGKLFRLEEMFPGDKIKHVPADYPTIQAAIDAALNGDTVLVAPGTYYENINFRGKAITVASYFIFDRNSATIEATIIDGRYPYNSDSASVVRFVSGEDSYACIRGFTLRNGTGTWSGGTARWGGGILCYKNSSPTIANNIIISNDAVSGFGGGICCISHSYPKIINNTIQQNTADCGGGISGGSVLETGLMIIANNLILQNTAYSGGGIDLCSGIITNNTIAENSGVTGVEYMLVVDSAT